MADRFTGSMDPARDGISITPDDDSDIDSRIKAIWANAAGTLVWDGVEGTDLSIVIAGAGPVPVKPRRIKTASSFAAGQLVGLFG